MRKSRKSGNAWKCRLRTSGGRRGPHNQVRQSAKIGAIASCALCNFRSSEGTEGKREEKPSLMAHEGPVGRTDCIQKNEREDELCYHSSISSDFLPNSPTVLAFAQIGCPRQNIPRFLGLPCFSPQIVWLPTPTTSCHLAITPTQLLHYCRSLSN